MCEKCFWQPAPTCTEVSSFTDPDLLTHSEQQLGKQENGLLLVGKGEEKEWRSKFGFQNRSFQKHIFGTVGQQQVQ